MLHRIFFILAESKLWHCLGQPSTHGPVIMARVVHHIKRKEANTRQAIQDRHRDYASFMELVRNARAPNDCTCICPSLHHVHAQRGVGIDALSARTRSRRELM